MPDLLTNGHPNGSGASLLTPARLLVGAGALLLVLISTGVVLILQANASHEARILRGESEIGLLRTELAILRTDTDGLKRLADATRSEQVERTKAFGKIDNALALIEQKFLYFSQSDQQRFADISNRLDTMSKRILSLSERLDRAPLPVPVLPPQHPPSPQDVIP